MEKKTASLIKDKCRKYLASCYGEEDWLCMPTVSGLALALGFNSKEEMFAFKGPPGVSREITRGLSILEDTFESALYKKETHQGAKFVLTNHFKGWGEKGETMGQATVTIIDDIGG